MAMSQAEIQLLIRARNEAQGTLDGLNKQLGVVRDQSNQAGHGMGALGEQAKGAGVQAGAASVAFGLLADRALRATAAAFGDSVKAANALDAGMIGLGATAKAFNQDAGQAKEAAKRLAADGLMPVGDAARGLKNLLAAGFGLDQAVVLMNRFKDSAAFGRQAALSLGEAVASATEGVKNGNSILVDNAGVTKNLSQMLTEAGFSAQDLSKASSDVNVRMALFNGIVKETNPQVGQAALYLATAAGQQAKFSAEVTIAQQKIGKELQPALGNLLATLTPMIKVIGDNAGAVVKFGEFMGLLLGPLVAVKAAAALGIPSLTGLGAAWTAAGAQAAVAGAEIQVASGGLQAMTSGVKAAASSMGIATTAGLVLGTAFASWQLGKLIGEWTGLTKAIEDAAGAAGRARGSVLGQANAQELLAKATQTVGREVRNVAEAEKIVTAQEAIRRGGLEKTITARLRQVDAELYLGRITQEQANAQKLALQAEQQAQEVQKKRIGLTEVLATKEKAFRDEVAATGYSLNELLGFLKKDENGFNAWAKAAGISDDTMKRLKDSLTAGTKAHADLEAAQRKAEAAAKALADAQQKTREELEKFGIVTQDQVNHHLDELRQKMWAAQAAGVPFQAVAIGLGQAFLDLANSADRAGVSSAAVRAEWNALVADAGNGLPPARELYRVLDGIGTLKTNQAIADIRVEVERSTEAVERTNEAFAAFGLKTPQALQQAADSARINFETLRASGQATTGQLEDAYQQMIDAQKAATGQLPSLWETEVLPAVKNTIGQIRTAIDGSFAQMLLGAKGFKDGFLDIWASLKKGVENILAQLLQSFIDNFLKKMIGAMSGQRGGFASAFSGLFGGGGVGGGTGSNGGGLGGLFGNLFGGSGTGPGVGPMPDGSAPGTGLMAGGGGMSGAMRYGGGAALMGAGIMQWMQGGTRNRITGGAQAGAGLGTMIAPGIGTLIGLGGGALAGWISTMFGPSAKEKDGREAARAAESAIVADLNEAQSAEAGGERWKQVAIAVRDAMKETGKGTDQEALAMVRQLWEAEKDGPDAVAAAYQRISVVMEEARKKRQAAADAGKQADAEQEARLATLKDKLKGLETTYQNLLDSVKDEAPEPDMGVTEKAIRKQAEDVKAQMEDVKRQIEDQIKAGSEAGAAAAEESGQRTEDAFDAAGEAARRLREKMDRELGDAHYVVGVEYDHRNTGVTGPGYGGGATPEPDLPGAAAGIYASGVRGVATWFGEGGEPEVGGPASFFERIFTRLGVDAGKGRRSGGDLNLVLNINGVLAESDLVRTIHEKVVPAIHSAWRDNTNSAQTTAREALGLT